MMHSRIKTALMLFLLLLTSYFSALSAVEGDLNNSFYAEYKVKNTFQHQNYKIVQFYLAPLSHYSYLLISEGRALCVDPGRDTDVYLEYAARENLEWEGTLLTQTHSDFIAGHREMASRTGAPIYVARQANALYPHVEINDGEKISFGKAVVRIAATPGHTADSICGLISSSDTPEMTDYILSGDTLLVGSFGRPELISTVNSAAQLAAMMFTAWHDKLAKISDAAVILPAHGNSTQSFSTIGREKTENIFAPFLTRKNEFIARMIDGLTPVTSSFKENARINRNGPEFVDWKSLAGVELKTLSGIIEQRDNYVIDVRPKSSWLEGHIPGSVNFSLQGCLEKWLPIIVPVKSRLILVGTMPEIEEASRRIRRVGYQADYILFSEYVTSGGNLKTIEQLSRDKFAAAFVDGVSEFLIIDVRDSGESLSRISDAAINIPLPEIEEQSRLQLHSAESMILVCGSEYGSVIAAGILARNGAGKLKVLTGEPEISKEPEEKADDQIGFVAPVKSGDAVSVEELIALTGNQDSKVRIIDIRSPEDFSDYNVVNSENFRPENIGGLELKKDEELILIDRDGASTKNLVGELMQKTGVRIRYLAGGIRSFWYKKEMPGVIKKKQLPANRKTDKPMKKPLIQPQTNKVKGAGC